MSRHNANTAGNGALLGLPIAAMLCCGIPGLIDALGFTAAGAFLTSNRYWIFGGLVILMGIVMFVKARKSKKSDTDACCMLPPTNTSPPKEKQ